MKLLDYIKEVQYDSLLDLDLTPPDLLALAELSYIEFERLMKLEDSCRLSQLAPFFQKIKPNISMTKDDLLLLEKMAASKRFGNLKVRAVKQETLVEQVQQFAAVSYQLVPNTWVIAFRGTDDSLIGWKEDMHLFYSPHIPSQDQALDYLRQVLPTIPTSAKIHLVGHSKGGHLAVHAASKLKLAEQKRIQSISTFDAPGHHDRDLLTPGYRAIQERIHRFSPRGSLVSQMLETAEEVSIIACRASTSFAQHNPYIWQIEGHDFLLVDGYNEDSKQIKATLKEWTQHHSLKEMEDYIDTLFHLLLDADIETTTGFLQNHKGRQIKAILDNWKGLTSKERKLIWHLSLVLVSIRARHWSKGWFSHPKIRQFLSKLKK